MKLKFFYALAFFSFLTNFAQPQEVTDDTEVSLLTCGSSKELYALFGHTALRFKDSSNGIDYVFNYGTFDFSTPNFYLKFVKGDLDYQLSWTNYESFYMSYRYDNRTVIQQKLNLTLEEKQKIWNAIWQQYNSDERYYKYKFIDANCTTKVADLINENTSYDLPVAIESNQGTYREILNNYLSANYFPMLGINLVFGKKVDRDSELIFLPDQLEKSVSATPKLELEKQQMYVSTYQPEKDSITPILFCAALVIVFVFSHKKIVQWTYGLILVLLVTLLIFISVYSQHAEVLDNPSVLTFNFLAPIYLLSKSKNKYLFIATISITIIGLLTSTPEAVSILAPLILLHISILLRVYFQSKKQINY